MAGHPERRALGEQAERREILRFEVRHRSIDPRHFIVAVDRRPPVARHVLDDRQETAGQRPVELRSSERRNHVDAVAERAIADRGRAAVDRDVEHRHAVDADAERTKVERDQLGAEKGRLYPEHRIPAVELGRMRRRADRRGNAAGRSAARGRPPGRSGSERPRARSTSRTERQSRSTCAGLSAFRLNRITPHGRASRRKADSSLESSVPARPQMKACGATASRFERASALSDSFRRPPSAIHRPSPLRRALPRGRPSPGSRCPSLRDPPAGFVE